MAASQRRRDHCPGLAALEDSVNVGVFRLHDGVWAEMAKYSSWQIADIDMLSPDEGWLVGSDNYPFGPVLLHYGRGRFDRAGSAAVMRLNGRLLGVSMTSPTEGFAVGATTAGGAVTDGIVLRCQNGQGSEAAGLPGEALVDVAMAGPDEGWAIGERGTTLHYAAGTWAATRQSAPVRLSGLALDGAGSGLAVGAGGRALRLHQEIWEPADTGLSGDLVAVSMPEADSAWAVGSRDEGRGGLIGKLEGGTWIAVQEPQLTGRLAAVDMLSPVLGWAGASSTWDVPAAPGILLRYGPPMPTPAPQSREPVELSGIVTIAEEEMSFTAVANGCPGEGRSWWIETACSDFWARFGALFPEEPAPPQLMAYARILGRLSPQGYHGHLGSYEHEIEVVRVLDMVRVDACPLSHVHLPLAQRGP
jgi:hypothetical protein